MGAPLYDITLYYNGQAIENAFPVFDFSQPANYIAVFYHDSLHGYKPPKTSRICIELGPAKNRDKPWNFGSICSYNNIIDETKYLSLSKTERYKYILGLLHSTVSEIARFYNWDQTIFDKAYDHIIESGFKFEKPYPEKKSNDRKYVGQIVLTKTEEKSILTALVTGGGLPKKEILLEKRNWCCYDRIYSLAKNCKWLDNSSFGIYQGERNCYFSTKNNQVINDLILNEDDIFQN